VPTAFGVGCLGGILLLLLLLPFHEGPISPGGRNTREERVPLINELHPDEGAVKSRGVRCKLSSFFYANAASLLPEYVASRPSRAIAEPVGAIVLRGRPACTAVVRPGSAGKRRLGEGERAQHATPGRCVRARVEVMSVWPPVTAERVMEGSIARDEVTRGRRGDTS